MSKGLIDLTRANKPPENPLTEPVKQGDPDSPTQESIPVVKAANTNEPQVPMEEVLKESTATTLNPVERTSTIGARIPESLHQTIKLFCIANRIEMQHFVQDALSIHLEKLRGTSETSTH